jgi:CPA2 family monovalent cation:H+ antiporter-2
MPGAEQKLSEHAELLLIGTEAQLKILAAAIKQRQLGFEQTQAPHTLRRFMLENHADQREQDFLSLAITIDRHSPLLGTSLKAANLRNKWSCLVIGLERGAITLTNPNVSLVFEENDLLWILGKQKMMNTLIREEIL